MPCAKHGCKCSHFIPNQFKPALCSNCSHGAHDHNLPSGSKSTPSSPHPNEFLRVPAHASTPESDSNETYSQPPPPAESPPLWKKDEFRRELLRLQERPHTLGKPLIKQPPVLSPHEPHRGRNSPMVRANPPVVLRRTSLSSNSSDKPFEILGESETPPGSKPRYDRNRRNSSLSICSMSTSSSSEMSEPQMGWNDVLKDDGSSAGFSDDDSNSVASMSVSTSATGSSTRSQSPKHKRNRSLFRKTAKPFKLPRDVISATWLSKKTKKYDQRAHKSITKTFKHRFAVLTDASLTYYEHVPFDEYGLRIESERQCGGLFLSTLTAVEQARFNVKHKCGVTLKSTNEHLYLSFDNVRAQKTWFDILTDLHKRNQRILADNDFFESKGHTLSPDIAASSPSRHITKCSTCPPTHPVHPQRPHHRRNATLPSSMTPPSPSNRPHITRHISSPDPSNNKLRPNLLKKSSTPTPFTVLSPANGQDLAAYQPSKSDSRPQHKGPIKTGFANDGPKFRRRKVLRSKTAPPSLTNNISQQLLREMAILTLANANGGNASLGGGHESPDNKSPGDESPDHEPPDWAFEAPPVLLDSPTAAESPAMEEPMELPDLEVVGDILTPPPPPLEALPAHCRPKSKPKSGSPAFDYPTERDV